MSDGAGHHQHFDAVPESTRAVRRAVSDLVTAWDREQVADDAVLGASELASNAVLHARGAFELAMRPINAGVRIEIIDQRPDLVPIPVPTTGSATGVTTQGTTGRGLQIVAAVASRWGFNTSQAFKAVWLEVADEVAPRVTEPIVENGYQATIEGDALAFDLRSLPVRAAVASGVQVDDLVRELQLSAPGSVRPDEVAELNGLLDTSAAARLLGRHAALEAAARNLDRFDLRVELSAATMDAFGALNRLLREMSNRLGPVVPLPDRVVSFRSWLVEEISAQASGAKPTMCPLPAD